MKKTMLLPDSFLAPFIANYECPVCGKRNRAVTLRYPRVRRNPPNIELGFPVRCWCGKAEHLKIVMPMLLFGYLLAWDALIDSERKFGRSEMILNITPSSHWLLQKLLPEYDSLLTQTAQQGKQVIIPSEPIPECSDAIERLRFGFSEQQWAEFLRRMGLGPDESNESSDS